MLKKIISAALAAAIAFALCACAEKAKTTENGFTVRGREYLLCDDFSVYGITKGEKYAVFNGEDVFTVEFEEPERFLCVDDSGDLIIYRAADLPKITLEEFGAIAAFIYDSSNTRWIDSFYADDEFLPEEQRGINESQDTALCYSITRALTEGESVEVSADDVLVSNRYFIRLLSQKYPGLYYPVVFFGDVQGRFYLRDRAADRSVACPRDVLARMIGSVPTEGGAENV